MKVEVEENNNYSYKGYQVQYSSTGMVTILNKNLKPVTHSSDMTDEEIKDYIDSFVDDDDDELEEVPEEEYVVYRHYYSNHCDYNMFTRGTIKDHVSYPEDTRDINDKSIKVYNSEEEASKIANKYNEISRRKGLTAYTNWTYALKWW